MSSIAICPASIGELIQGEIGGQEMLVSCPISIYNLVEVEICINNGIEIEKEKIYKAFDIFLKSYRIEGIKAKDFKVTINSSIPRGKGMASSTADIAAGLTALSNLLDISLKQDDTASIAVQVEPTDSTVFNMLTLYDHLEGKHREIIGPVPKIEFLLLEGRGVVDTLSFRRDKSYINRVASVDEAYEKLYKGVMQEDIKLIAEACTESAVSNQRLLYKPYLDKLLEIAKKCNAPGINIAHSGTVSGVILDKDTDKEKLLHLVDRELKECFERKLFVHTTEGASKIIDE